ncbi:osmoprotectant uptake system permease [Enterobacterales bacterium CwR94]|nr:osmoprotectant uptake system permease [Enterobacterales bacterium CwR94]
MVSHLRPQSVALTLWVALLMAALWLPFLNYAPNRLVSGEPQRLSSLLTGIDWLWALIPLLGLLLLSLRPARTSTLITMIGLCGLLITLTLLLSGREAARLAVEGTPLARTSFGSGLWCVLALCLLMAAEAVSRLTRSVLWRLVFNVLLWLPVIVLLVSGQLDQVALLKEYANRRDVFDAALLRHLFLLIGTLLPALLIGVPLGVWCYRHASRQSGVFSVLNIIQTVPSVALFGLLIAPLAALVSALPWLGRWGISGTGVAPALIALVLYALLPLVRSVVTGLQQVPADVLETARGMGMGRAQIFWQVEVPLALPLLISGLRVVAVQTVGMAVIAALIGAGGFGSIIFQGLLSSATELVLLGVIPVIALAVMIDGLFKILLSWVTRGRG